MNSEYFIFTMEVVVIDKPQVQFEEETFFDLKKGEKITFHLIAIEKNVTNIKKINLFLSNSSLFKIDKESCPETGCEFTVEAL